MSRKLVIFCIPLGGLGHINASIGLCDGLRQNGHRIVFGVERSWEGTFLKYGFEEEVYDERERKEGEVDGKFWSDFFDEHSKYFREHNAEITRSSYKIFTEAIKYSNNKVQEIIARLKPDFIIQDNYVAYPCIVNSGIPYAVLWSANPLIALHSTNLPPINSCEPIDDSSNWQRLTDIRNEALHNSWQSFSKWMIEQGSPQLAEYRFQYDTMALNIGLYPKSLFEDYAKRVTLKDNWMLLEHAVRITPTDFHLPEEFKQKPGKLIYVAMGSMATANVPLMKRLVEMLSKSEHKFILSLGSNFDKYEIAENMWGQRRVPQLEVLKICDLFITHGGNNSFIEGLYFGVPMIVMPLFGDQHSNAQRAVEMKLGSKMNVFEVSEQQLLNDINKLLEDKKLKERSSKISEELVNSNSMSKIVNRIETIAGL